MGQRYHKHVQTDARSSCQEKVILKGFTKSGQDEKILMLATGGNSVIIGIVAESHVNKTESGRNLSKTGYLLSPSKSAASRSRWLGSARATDHCWKVRKGRDGVSGAIRKFCVASRDIRFSSAVGVDNTGHDDAAGCTRNDKHEDACS